MNFYCAGEQLIDLSLHKGHLQDFSDGGSFIWVLYQHL